MTSFQWECPNCYDSKLSAETSAELRVQVRKHIAEHERRAGLFAVEEARRTCSREASGFCGLAKETKGLLAGQLTVYDRMMLREMKIRWDDDSHYLKPPISGKA